MAFSQQCHHTSVALCLQDCYVSGTGAVVSSGVSGEGAGVSKEIKCLQGKQRLADLGHTMREKGADAKGETSSGGR